MATRSDPHSPVRRQGMARAGSFESFYVRELPMQLRRATLLVGDEQLARDLVHDAFADVFQRWGRLRDPGPYLNVAVVNRCRDHGRKSARRSRLDATQRPPDQPPHLDPLWDALGTLPFHHRAVLVLRFYQQLTDREIAETLGCRIGSVGPWMQRGLRQLRKDLS